MADTQQLVALIKACDFAAKKHRNQKRKDGLGTGKTKSGQNIINKR